MSQVLEIIGRQGAEMERRFASITELSEYLNISRHTLYSWVSRKKIPHLKISGTLRFDMRDIEKWLKEKKVKVSDICRKKDY